MTEYSEYISHMKELAALSSSAALLQWDQEVYMPIKGSQFRAEQLALLSTLIHKYASSDKLGHYLESHLEDSKLNEAARINIRRSKEDYDKAVKIPASLVEEISRAQSEAFQAWIKARKENDFKIFKPYLAQIIQLQRKYAEALGTSPDPYETLMDLYDPGIKLNAVNETFEKLIDGIHKILQAMDGRFKQHLPKGDFPSDLQKEFGEKICKSLGFDFKAGRQDISVHPFTIGLHPRDVRITTRIDEKSLAYMLWSTIHECGHALYEQGLPAEMHGLPLAQPASISIHESQSRLYENNLGRSKVFINYWFPEMQEIFPDALNSYDSETYFRAINRIEPNLIRTEADELHYHLHIYIRFLIERDLMHGKLDVSEVKERWNALYKEHLGVTVSDDVHGILQDVHWSHGSIGYFPTYTLGSLYAAQFMEEAYAQIPNLHNSLEKGKYTGLLQWLREHIHSKGRSLSSDQLCQKICGKSLDASAFISYSEKKYLH